MYSFLFVLDSWPQIPLAQGKANSLDVLMKASAAFSCRTWRKESFGVLGCINPVSLLACFHFSLWIFVDAPVLKRVFSAPKFGCKTPSCACISHFCAQEPAELHAARPPDIPPPHPREVNLGTAGTGETTLWNNQHFIKVKSNGIWFFFFFLNPKVLLCPFCTCMFPYAYKPGVQHLTELFFGTAAGEIAPNEKQHAKKFISPFCKTAGPKETFAKHGVSFSTGLVGTLKLGSAATINTHSLRRQAVCSLSLVARRGGRCWRSFQRDVI